MDIDVDTGGFEDAFTTLDEYEDDFEDGGTWVVGTAVEYAIYLEFGTSKMDAKPFFRPVLVEVRAQGVEDFIEDNTRKTISDIGSADELVRSLAFAIERRVKEVITRKGLIDTGTLEASVKAVPGADVTDLPSADEVDASAAVEVDT